ncbi:AlbA family DNA-binding domain-containing protein [Streptomyces sp. NBC_00525]|uniref:AlbA family DNA-binding domain-containing protein n=1 Tax=Streptomyces sp. NBC_00525 TaxID=2903660 RepID=UPI002E8201C2|nr:ATP-binding protein [Streptomyces sp. NBC_00525]WUC98116.1 ATP-binding protein [Streptomyces sp. NBC_00525]
MARIWTRLHEHLGCPPGPVTFDMVRQAAANNLEESDDLDWKEMLPQPPRDGRWNELAKDVAAMANTRGGLIIFGVQDKTTALTGIDAETANPQQYTQWIRNHVHPYLPDLDISVLTDDVKSILVVDVPASEMAPHFVYGGAARDKEQQTAVVPYRDHDHTAWMAEHQIERAYRDRFARIGSAEEEIQRHTDFLVQSIGGHDSTPSAWFIAVARPQRPLPRGAYRMNRDEARAILEAAASRALDLHPHELVPGPLRGMGLDTLYNPRPGLHRWVCNNFEMPINRETVVELLFDGTVVMAANLSYIRDVEEPPVQGDDLPVSNRVVTACCCDFVATVQEQQRKLRLDSTMQLTASITSPNGRAAFVPRTSTWGHGRESTPTHARRPHHLQPVHSVLSPAADDGEGTRSVDELRTDLMNQFGL